MFIIYLSATNGKNYGHSKTVVRAEIAGTTMGEIVRYYEFDNCGFDLSKLKVLGRILKDVPMDYSKDAAVFFDSYDLVDEWERVKKEDLQNVRFIGEWKRVQEELKKFKFIPDIRDKGVLSMALRDEVRMHLIRNTNY